MGLIETPTMITAAGSPPKRIAEYVGRLNTGSIAISVARMVSPGGWEEPGQTPEFDEYSLVLRGSVRIETRAGVTNVTAGQAFFAAKGEWVRYSTPEESGAEYLAICVPAFSSEAVHRDRTTIS
jgi:mannose-6-phosphate isomerase-like protein (cupin superfamily)